MFDVAVTNFCWEEANTHSAGPADLPGAHLPRGPVSSTASLSLVGETAGASKMDHPKF